MSERLDPPRPAGWEGARWSDQASKGAATPGEPPLVRFLGGSPAAVMLRLFVVSMIVGAILMWLDIRPWEIFSALERFLHRLWMLGFDAVREVFQYVLAGAVIVVPVWFVVRLLNVRK